MVDISKHPILGELYEIGSYLDGGALPSSLESTSLISHFSDVTNRIEKLIDRYNEMRKVLLENNIHKLTGHDCWCEPTIIATACAVTEDHDESAP